MPSVSVPSIGSGFYVPGSSGFYTGQKNVPAGSTANSTTPSAQNADTTSDSSAQPTTQVQTSSALATALTGSSQAQTLAPLNDSLTAGDISSLNSLGLLGSFSNLLGAGGSASSLAGISGLQTSASSTAENALLQQILSELNELKKSVANQTQKGTAAKTTVTGAQTAQTPSILRFLINGTDMIPFCKTVFFSDTETDGSFLLTGDCHYALNGTTRTETFYILFHANGAKNGMQTFTVTPSLSQQTEDKSTYLYKISTLENLTAQKTGNLITLKAAQNGTTLNMLLSF